MQQINLNIEHTQVVKLRRRLEEVEIPFKEEVFPL